MKHSLAAALGGLACLLHPRPSRRGPDSGPANAPAAAPDSAKPTYGAWGSTPRA